MATVLFIDAYRGSWAPSVRLKHNFKKWGGYTLSLYWKGPGFVLMWGQEHISAFIFSQEYDCLPNRRVWALMALQPLVSPQKSWYEVLEPVFLTFLCHHAEVWEKKEDPSYSVDLLHKLLDLSESYLLWNWPKNAHWMFVSLSILYLWTQNSFYHYGI